MKQVIIFVMVLFIGGCSLQNIVMKKVRSTPLTEKTTIGDIMDNITNNIDEKGYWCKDNSFDENCVN